MKIQVETGNQWREVEIVIRCQEENEDIQQLIHLLKERARGFEKGVAEIADGQKRLVGLKEGKHYLLQPADIFYFESVESKVYIYGKANVYESKLKLYEIETLFEDKGFVRISKSMVLNLSKIKSFSAVFYGKFEVTMENGEKAMISRQYVPLVKKRLGL